MGSWYKWLWTRIGGRPWTFIIRDSWHDWAVVWIMILLTLGFMAASYVTKMDYLKGIGIFLIGYIFGHLFWGKPWIKGQKGGH
jgi:hypothetical protein